jgi:hypothetical protein
MVKPFCNNKEYDGIKVKADFMTECDKDVWYNMNKCNMLIILRSIHLVQSQDKHNMKVNNNIINFYPDQNVPLLRQSVNITEYLLPSNDVDLKCQLTTIT